jgi:hypothetical protein
MVAYFSENKFRVAAHSRTASRVINLQATTTVKEEGGDVQVLSSEYLCPSPQNSYDEIPKPKSVLLGGKVFWEVISS